MSDIRSTFAKTLGPSMKGKTPAKMAEGGSFCMHCGGPVDEAGYAEGGEVDAPSPAPKEESRAQKLYAAALRMKEEKR